MKAASLCIATATVVVGSSVFASAVAGQQGVPCRGEPGARTGPRPSTAVTTLDRGAKSIDLRFDASRESKTRTVSLGADPDLEDAGPLNIEIEEDLVTAEKRTWSPDEGVTVTKRVTGAGNLDVCLELRPKEVRDLSAGRYVGAILISVGGDKVVSVPIEATLKKSSERAWFFASLGALLGLILKILGELAAAKKSTRNTWGRFKRYIGGWSFWTALFATPVVVIAGYYVLYSGNSTWGTEETDQWKLFLTCLGYQLGGEALIDIVKGVVEPDPPTT